MKRTTSPVALQRQALRNAARNEYVADMRDGRIVGKAATFPDRTKVQNKNACRGKMAY